MPGWHARFGGSSAERWMACPGSVQLSEKAPPATTSAAAAEGTCAHEVLELCLKAADTTAAGYLGLAFGEVEVDQEMVEGVDVALDWFWAIMGATPDAVYSSERTFTLAVPGCADDEVGGTNDVLIYSAARRHLWVGDFKYGRKPVEVRENAQAMFYTLGALAAERGWEVDTVSLVIVQPRTFKGFPVSTWNTTPLEVLGFELRLEDAIAEAKGPSPRIVPGPHCLFCPAATICPATSAEALSGITGGAYDDLVDLPLAVLETESPAEMTPDRLGDILVKAPLLEAWLDACRRTAEAMLRHGVAIPGQKLVQKVGRRAWDGDPELIATVLKAHLEVDEDEIAPRKLVTISAVEKLVRRKHGKDRTALETALGRIAAQTTKNSSGVTMVPSSDARDAVAITAPYADLAALPAA